MLNISNKDNSHLDWTEVIALAEQLELAPFECFLAGFAHKAVSEGLRSNQLREMLMQPGDNLLLKWVLASEGLSFIEQPEKVRARVAVAVINLREVGLWPW